MRRSRATDWSRRLVREHTLTVDDLIWPVFVQEGEGLKSPIPSMPGVHRYSIDLLVDAGLEAEALGIPAVAIFPVTPQDRKSAGGEESFNEASKRGGRRRGGRDAGEGRVGKGEKRRRGERGK